MKRMVLSALLCWVTIHMLAAEPEWLTDFSKAQAKAKAEKKLVLLDFNGSDWCPPCKALRSKVLSQPEFVQYAQKNLVLVDVDFPRAKKQSEEQKRANQQLQEKFNVEGYPTVIVLDSDGKELKKTVGYEGQTAKEFIAELEKLKKRS